MGVALQIQKQFDRIAKGIQNSLANYSGDDFWTLSDAAGDETYENRVNNSTMTAVDAALASGAVWSSSALAEWFRLHSAYFSTDLALTAPVFDSYLASVGFRAPYEAAEALVQAMGSGNRLYPRNVFPKGTLVGSGDPANTGMHKFATILGTAGAPTFTDVDGALDTTKVLAAPVLITNNEATPGPSSLVLRYTLQDGTTKDITVALSATTQYAQTIVGKQAITGVAGAVFSCAATSQFKVGEWVLLSENADGDTSIREVAQIKAIVTNTSVEFEAAPVNTFTSAGFIIPQFSDVAFVSGTLGDGKTITLWALPDRIITL